MESKKPNCGQLTYRAKSQSGIEPVPPDSDLWKFAESWLKRFNETEEKNAAEKFIFLWITMNAWASLCVPDRTQNHIDAYLVHSMSADPRLSDRFEKLTINNSEFSRIVMDLTRLGPIFQVLWMRNKHIKAWDAEKEFREDFVLRMKDDDPFNLARDGHKIPAFAPGCAFQHIEAGESIPSDWPHTLSMIYQIRCNLFHGGKNYDSKRDRQFIKLAYSILWEVWCSELPPKLKEQYWDNPRKLKH